MSAFASKLVDDVAAVSPAVAASKIWLVARDEKMPTRTGVLNHVAEQISDKFGQRYGERFFEISPDVEFSYEAPSFKVKQQKAECVLSIESYLRRFALDELGIDPQVVTLAFEDHPVYARSADLVKRYSDYLDALVHAPVAVCTTCHLIGQVDAWFGWNRGGAEPTPQSRCKCCTATGALSKGQQARQGRRKQAPRTREARVLQPTSGSPLTVPQQPSGPPPRGKASLPGAPIAATAARHYNANDLDAEWDRKDKECPRCGVLARGRLQVMVKFGARTLNDKVEPQSYCRMCR